MKLMPLNIQFFATSGATEVTVANYIKLRFSWTSGTPNNANNYTPVNWKLELISTNSSARISSTASKNYSVTVDGKTWSGTNTVGLSGGATKTLASGSKNIYHNADGSKSFSYSFSQGFDITYSGSQVGTKTGSGSGTLNAIPRGSVLGSISAFTIGNAITIPITKYSTSYTDTLTISVGGTVIKTVSSISNNASVSFTATELNNIYAKLPTATSGTFTFKLTTKSGTTTIGTSTKTVKGTIPSTIKPTISSVSLSEYVSGLATQFGAYIQNKSRISGTVNAAAGTGSSIESYKITINGTTYTSRTFTTNVLKTSGSNSYSVTVTDKRGRTASTSGTFNVLAYTSPTISSFSVVRSNANGTANDEGAYAKINASASISSLNSKNTKSFVLQYKLKSATTWTNLETYTGGYTYTVTNKIISNINVDNPYDFRIVATDYFGAVNSKVIALSTAYTILDIKANGKGIAFGKVATEDNVQDIGFDKTYLSDNTYLGGQANNDTEKNLFFTNTGNGLNKHNVKLYGGNGNSITSVGLWDVIKDLPIFQYFDGNEYRLKFGDNIVLRWGQYDIEATLEKIKANNSGRIHYKNGLLIQWGSVSITPVANTPTSAKVTYPVAYDYVPSVKVSCATSVVGTQVLGYTHGNDTSKNTDLFVTRTTATATTLRWLAIGFKEV